MKCCHKRCAMPPVEGSARCEKHTAHHRAESKTKREANRPRGLCGICSREALPGKARCARHDSSMGVYRCRLCGVLGHNRRTCTTANKTSVGAREARR